MQWVWEPLSFRGTPFQVAHFEAPGRGMEELSDDLVERLDRCEAELGACLWHDTNHAALDFLQQLHPDGYAGLRVLELGAGPGVCGIALAVDGADAIITDLDSLVPLLEVNAARNGFCSVAAPPNASGKAVAKPKRSRKRGGAKGRRSNDDDEEDFSHAGAVEVDAPEILLEEEDVDMPKRLSAKERRAAREATKSARKAGSSENTVADVIDLDSQAVNVATGNCVAAAADWNVEVEKHCLDDAAFDVVIVCDCLYDNKASWISLTGILERVTAAGGEVVLASATLRRPFLDEFSARLEASGHFVTAQKTETPVAGLVCLLSTPS